MTTVVVSGATVTAMPSPTIVIGSKNAVPYAVAGPDQANSAKPAAKAERPPPLAAPTQKLLAGEGLASRSSCFFSL